MSTPLRVGSDPMPDYPSVKRSHLAETQAPGSTVQPFPWRFVALIGGALVLILALSVSLYLRGETVDALEANQEALKDVNRHLKATVEAAEAEQASRDTCDPYSDQIRDLQQLLNQGKFAMVQEMAELYLNDHQRQPCPETKLALARLAYNAAFDNILVAPLDGRTATLRWQENEHKAEAYGLPMEDRIPAMSVVTRAYNAGLWELAHAAFLKAWGEGAVDQHSLQQVQHYYAILRNWGKELSASDVTDDQRAGLTYLRTASEIAQAWGLAQGEAYQDLTTLLGPEVDSWPPADRTDPVLAAAGK